MSKKISIISLAILLSLSLLLNKNKIIPVLAEATSWKNSGNNMYSNVSGFVGIGTTSPRVKLDIVGTADASGSTNTGLLEIGNALRFDSNEIITNTNTALYIQGGNNGDLIIDSGTLSIDASTNKIGIGTTAPGAKLDIQGTADASGTTNTGILEIGNALRLDANEIITNTNSTLNIQGGNNGDLIVDSGTFTVDSSVNKIGIGTTAPGAILDIQGTADASGTTNTGILEIGNALRLDANEIITNTNSTLYIQGGNNGDVVFDGNTLMIDSSANYVGIGNVTPSTNLDITGNEKISGRLSIGSNINNNSLLSMDVTLTPTDAVYAKYTNLDITNDYSLVVDYNTASATSDTGTITDLFGTFTDLLNEGAVDITVANPGHFKFYNNSTGTVDSAIGIDTLVSKQGTGEITNALGISSIIENTSATNSIVNASALKSYVTNGTDASISTLYGLNVSGGSNAGSIGTAYGLLLGDWMGTSGGTVTTSYGIFISDDIDRGSTNYPFISESLGSSYFLGKLGVGVNNPLAELEVDGGLRLNTATERPACGVGTRGEIWFVQGGDGVADTFDVCAKDSGNSYAWRSIY